MSNKGGASSEVISVPRGGGALHGIGEKFSPDLHTGTGNFTVPLSLPPGRNGFQPKLNLVYSTGNGNGPFGLGWSLGVPGVSRKTSKGVPRYDDERDTFILSGAEDLVPVSKNGTVTHYRPRTEGLFARIAHHQDASHSDDYWEVRSKDGLVSLYGAKGVAGNSAVIADPSQRSKVFGWKLTETRDPFGNRIKYEYERDSGEEGPRQWDQLYLKRIWYADYEDQLGQQQFLISVAFEYEESPDPFSECRSGFEVRTRKRCKQIVVRTHAEKERLVRTYKLIYLDARVTVKELPASLLPLNGVSLLSQVRVIGHDGDATEALPPLEFAYTQFTPQERDFFPVEGRDLPALSLSSPDLALVDLFGNGLPDILQMNGIVRYWRNLGGGRFDLPREMRDAPGGLALADPGVQLIDANGDGRTDLLVTSNELSGYFPLSFEGGWDRRSFQRYRQAPSFNLEDPEVRLVDMDGDGVTDAVRSGSRFELFFNDPSEGWNRTLRIARKALEDFPNVNFSDPRVKWADMTGDGLQDIVLVYDGNVEYWPHLGRGNWGPRIHMRKSPRFPYGYDPKRILVGDVDGDGLADLVYIDNRKVLLWINRSGGGWSDPIEIDGTPPVTDMDDVRLVDLLGTGVSGVLWSASANGTGPARMFFLDFTGGLKPYLLSEMDNHMGAVTRVEYAPSTRFYLEDQKHLKTRWQTPLPFPVQVVSRVEVIDELSRGKLTTQYRPRHGYWDGAEREFRGFGMVEQLDTETFATYHAAALDGEKVRFTQVEPVHFSPPTLTKTWFHQGPVGEEFGDWYEADYTCEYWFEDPPLLERLDPTTAFLKNLPRRAKRDAFRTLRGNILRTEFYALDGTERQDRPYTVTESLFGLREEAVPGPGEKDRLRIFFPHLLAQRTTQWERGDDPMTQFSFTRDYDAYGLPLGQTQVACPRGWRKWEDKLGERYLATRTRTTYAPRDDDDAQVYIVSRVAKMTTYEIDNDGNRLLSDLRDLPDTSLPLKVISQTLNYYDGEAFQGLPLGNLGAYGALVRTESLVLTEKILHEAYKSGDSVLSPPEVPPYLTPGSTPAWTAEYPQAFRDGLPSLAGYVFDLGDGERERGYFATTLRRRYDFHNTGKRRGLLVVMRDALGRDTALAYDAYGLLPTAVTDPAGLTTQAVYDYRVLQPRKVTDPNGNWQSFGFTALGLLAWSAAVDKQGKGDTEEKPGTRLAYNFLAFTNSSPDNRQPISVRTLRRKHHVNEEDVPPGAQDDTIETFDYSDGFGRLLQSRAQAEDLTFGDPVFGGEVLLADQTNAQGTEAAVVGRQRAPDDPPNVVVSGWQTYNNKGWVVEKYEPFFASGWDYLSREEAIRLKQQGSNLFGQTVTTYYDPRGQAIRTVNPDGSEQRVVYGIPEGLTNPENFTPTPWEACTYDANDNAGRTHATESGAYKHHWNTPIGITVDALGRTTRVVERNGSEPADAYTTISSYDIRGNLITVTDALGRLAFRHVYDLSNNPLRVESIDAGIQRTVLDALGNVIELRSGKGSLILKAYDVIARPVRLWGRDAVGEPLTLREQVIYGDNPESGLTLASAAARNLLGKPIRHYDEAGRLLFESYDFKSNLVEKVRQVAADEHILTVFADASSSGWNVSAYRMNWQAPLEATLEEHAASLLDAREYRTSSTFDALNRLKSLRYPEDMTGERQELRPDYNHGGALQAVTLGSKRYVDHIAYNAKGQRSLVAYANGILTRYAYDPAILRLSRLRTERCTAPAAYTYAPSGAPLQDFAYEYDLAGNLIRLRDRTPGSGVPNTLLGIDALDRRFTYDPLYRLREATGREHATPPVGPPWADMIKSHDPTLARAYTEEYEYDAVGNLLELRHIATGGSFTRALPIVPGSNRLASLIVSQTTYEYSYDDCGNITRGATTRHFEWDHSNRLRAFYTQAGTAEPTVHAHYLYDSSGQRVKKVVRMQGGHYESITYVDGMFEHHRWTDNGVTKHNARLHVMDGEQRLFLVRIGDVHPADKGPPFQHHLGDHLASNTVVIDESGTWLNREEFTPYGETAFGGFSRKRYRFTGKERDEETGFLYHGARYYVPWLARWASTDPAGGRDRVSLYPYVRSNPMLLVDSDGREAAPVDRTPGRSGGTWTSGGKWLREPGTTLNDDPAFKDIAEEVWSRLKQPDYNKFRAELNARIKGILKDGESHPLKSLLEIRKIGGKEHLFWKSGTPFAGQRLHYAHWVSQGYARNLGLDRWITVERGNLSPVGETFHLKEYGHLEEGVYKHGKAVPQEAIDALKKYTPQRPPSAPQPSTGTGRAGGTGPPGPSPGAPGRSPGAPVSPPTSGPPPSRLMIAGRMAGAALSAAFVLGIAVELIEAARGNAPPERPTMSPVPGGTIMTNPYLLKEGETKEIPLGTLKMEGGTLYLNGIPQQG